MTFRCPGCNKFCSVEMGDSDLQAEASGGDEKTVHIHISGTITLISACCGEPVAETEIDDEVEINPSAWNEA